MLDDQIYFFKFAYQLRVYESYNTNSKDFYTNYILNLVPEIDPLYKVILLSNSFQNKIMQVELDTKFKIQIGAEVPKTILSNGNSIYSMKNEILTNKKNMIEN